MIVLTLLPANQTLILKKRWLPNAHTKMFSSLKFDYRGLFLTSDTSTSITKESHVLLREIEVNYSCLEISCVVQSYAFYVILKSYTYEVTYFIS